MRSPLAEVVEQERGERSWTQAELAESSGVSLATVGAIERGERIKFHHSTLRRLDAVFGWESGRARSLADSAAATPDAVARANQTLDSEPLRGVIVVEGKVTKFTQAMSDGERLRYTKIVNDRGAWTVHQNTITDVDATVVGDQVRIFLTWRSHDDE